MDMYNLTEKIPYLIFLGIGTAVVLHFHISGIRDFSVNIEAATEGKVQKATVLENTVNFHPDTEFNYTRRRAVIPVNATRPRTQENPAGFKTGEDGHCYIPEVEGLDGVEYGLVLGTKTDDRNFPGSAPVQSYCSPEKASTDVLYSPVILARPGKNYEKQIGIYEIS